MNVRFGPERMTPAVRALLIANVAVFVIQMLLQNIGMLGVFNGLFGLSPSGVFRHYFIWQLATYMFLHGSMSHIFWNMLVLWMFGVDVEARMGTVSFLKFYFLCGVGAGLTSLGLSLIFPAAWFTLTVGASGAIYGIFVASAVFFPESMILVFFLFPMRMKHAVILFGAVQLFVLMSGRSGNVSTIAHLGGIIFALGYFHLGPRLKRSQAQRERLRAQTEAQRGQNEEREVDRILDKINREGIQSLTQRERNFLKSRSERRDK